VSLAWVLLNTNVNFSFGAKFMSCFSILHLVEASGADSILYFTPLILIRGNWVQIMALAYRKCLDLVLHFDVGAG